LAHEIQASAIPNIKVRIDYEDDDDDEDEKNAACGVMAPVKLATLPKNEMLTKPTERGFEE